MKKPNPNKANPNGTVTILTMHGPRFLFALAAAACTAFPIPGQAPGTPGGGPAGSGGTPEAPIQTPAGPVNNQAPANPSPAAGALVMDSLSAQKKTPHFSDAEILGWILAVDNNEIAAATLAEKKELGFDAMSYAKMLHNQHRADAAKTAKLANKIKVKPARNDAVKQLRDEGAAEVAALSGKDREEFEKAYSDAMVKDHDEALATIDSTLIPDAKNADLRKHLAEVRNHVSMHLEHGRSLQNAQASAPPQ